MTYEKYCKFYNSLVRRILAASDYEAKLWLITTRGPMKLDVILNMGLYIVSIG